MKRLRSRPRVDTLQKQHRWDPGRWGRRVYLILIAAIALIILDYAVGDAVLLRADGMVISDRYAVGATYPAKVAAVYIKEGEHIAPGQVLAKLESAAILKDIAELSVQYADITARNAQLKIRAGTTHDLMPLAEKHANQTARAMAKYEKMPELIPTIRKDQALGSEYATAARLAELKSESRVIGRQLPLLDEAHKRAKDALTQLEVLEWCREKRSNTRRRQGRSGPTCG
jgi:multidrug efflux pump subunit AcrA (membrane-fusion protein)